MKMAGRWLLQSCLWPILLLKSVIYRWYWKKMVKMFFLNSLYFFFCLHALSAVWCHRCIHTHIIFSEFFSKPRHQDTMLAVYISANQWYVHICKCHIGYNPHWHFYKTRDRPIIGPGRYYVFFRLLDQCFVFSILQINKFKMCYFGSDAAPSQTMSLPQQDLIGNPSQ